MSFAITRVFIVMIMAAAGVRITHSLAVYLRSQTKNYGFIMAGVGIAGLVSMGLLTLSFWPLSDVLVMVSATALGCWIGNTLQTRPSLTSFLVVVAVVDVVSALNGAVPALSTDSAEPIIQQLYTFGMSYRGQWIPALSGESILGLAILFTALHNLKFSRNIVIGVPAIAIAAATLINLFTEGIPVYPFFAAITGVALALAPPLLQTNSYE